MRRSVLFPDVTVLPHAEISESVILPGAVIGRRCRLRGTIVDSGCRVPDGTVIERPTHARALSEEMLPAIVTQEDFAVSFTGPGAPLIGESAIA